MSSSLAGYIQILTSVGVKCGLSAGCHVSFLGHLNEQLWYKSTYVKSRSRTSIIRFSGDKIIFFKECEAKTLDAFNSSPVIIVWPQSLQIL